MNKFNVISGLLTLLVVMFASPAYAYIGPGAAVAFLGYAFGPVIAIVVSVGLIFAWVGRMIWKRVKGNKTIITDTASTAMDDQSDGDIEK